MTSAATARNTKGQTALKQLEDMKTSFEQYRMKMKEDFDECVGEECSQPDSTKTESTFSMVSGERRYTI